MNLVKKFTIHLFGPKRKTTMYLSDGMEDIIREIGSGRLHEGIKKLVLCGYLIKEFDGRSFDRGFWQLCRVIEHLQNPDNDGDNVKNAVLAKSELEELEDQIKNDEAELAMKKFKLGIGQMQADVERL